MELTNFSFNTDIIQVFDEQGQYVSVKNLCKNIGIDFKTQYEKILSDESFCPKSFKVETNGGAQVALCIPVEKINGWLFSINPNKVKPEIKAKLILYKNECFDVLYKHFNASKFEAYVGKIADLNAVLIDNAKRHKREINGYKSQISQHNALIASLKTELAEFKPKNGEPRYKTLKTLLEHARKERDFYRTKSIKLENEKRDKELRTFRALQQTKERLDHVFTAIGAIEAYVANDDRFFMEQNEILKG